jgi:geranylgeranyl transferase type-1 subunit beta
MLALLADDDKSADEAFRHVDREKTLLWLKRLQREDGSFGEHVVEIPGKGWVIGGGYDMRHCYLASSVRWMIRGDMEEQDRAWVEDIDVDRLVKHISRSQVRMMRVGLLRWKCVR